MNCFLSNGPISAQSRGDLRLSMSVLAETQLFQHGQWKQEDNETMQEDVRLNSKIVSARITVNGHPVTEFGAGHMKTLLSPIETPGVREDSTV